MRTFPLLLIPVLVVAACSNDSSTPETSQPDTSAVYTPSDDSSRPYVAEESDTIPVGPAFEPAVYRAFARAGVAVPPSVTDSLFKAISDNRKIPQEMEKLMQHHDSLARKQVAERFGITVDSLATILAKGTEGKW
jgi:hypothetical protein